MLILPTLPEMSMSMLEITTGNLKLAGNLSSIKIKIIILIAHPSNVIINN